MEIHGFGVDSEGVLYVGKDNRIEKYYEGEMIGTIKSVYIDRGYLFTVNEDDTILVAYASVAYTFDKEGNVTDKQEDMDVSKIYYGIRDNMHTFITADNTVYSMKSHFGKAEISTGGEVLYKTPPVDNLAKWMFWLLFLNISINIPLILIKVLAEKK